MSDDDIKALAYQAAEGETGPRHFSADLSWLLAFARKVQAAERERGAAWLAWYDRAETRRSEAIRMGHHWNENGAALLGATERPTPT